MPSSDKLLEIIAIQTEVAKLGVDLGGVMGLVVEKVLPLIGADGAAIELSDGEDMVYRAASGMAEGQIGLRVKLEHSLSGLCVRTGKTLSCADSDSDNRVDRQACRAVGLRSMIVMPLLHKGEAVGALKAMSRVPNHFRDEDMQLLQLLSEVVAAAMFFSTKYDTDDLFHRATHDGMTDLANRSLFMDRLRNTVLQGDRDQQPVGVLMIDMDGLKSINDNHGHLAGDAVLVEFANRIRSAARQSDTVARLGGDEFAIILDPVEPTSGVLTAINRLTEQLTAPFTFEERSYALQASIGAAEFPTDGHDIGTLIQTADQRMYAQKRMHHADVHASQAG